MVRTKTKRMRPVDLVAGDTSDNPQHGWGIGWVDESQRYIGQFQDGIPHGFGRSRTLISQKWPLGRSKGYEGEWQNGQQHGRGIGYCETICGFLQSGGLASRSDKWYEGEWQNGHPAGHGAEFVAWHTSYASLYPDADDPNDGTWPRRVYEGQWQDGERCGHGDSFSVSGKLEYRGQWLSGAEHGCGIRYSADGDVEQQGRWEAGSLVENCEVELDTACVCESVAVLEHEFFGQQTMAEWLAVDVADALSIGPVPRPKRNAAQANGDEGGGK